MTYVKWLPYSQLHFGFVSVKRWPVRMPEDNEVMLSALRLLYPMLWAALFLDSVYRCSVQTCSLLSSEACFPVLLVRAHLQPLLVSVVPALKSGIHPLQNS